MGRTRKNMICAKKNHQKGLSIIELMLSIVLGLFISGVTLYAYNHALLAAKSTVAQSRMNEDAQNALDILTTQISLAGYNPDQANYAQAQPRNPLTEVMSIRACGVKFSNIDLAGTTLPAASIEQLICPLSSKGANSIAVSYEATKFNTIPTVTKKEPTDCVGRTLFANTTVLPPNIFYEADNRFYIDTKNKSTEPSLYCNSTAPGAVAQPLVENIEDLKFTFGTAPADSAPGTVAGYLTPNQIENNFDNVNGLVNLATAQLRWDRVSTVQICLVVRSADPVLDTATTTYLDCDGQVATSKDRRIRRAYFATVELRNRVL
jgi:type IV pilus assembly protein PilW